MECDKALLKFPCTFFRLKVIFTERLRWLLRAPITQDWRLVYEWLLQVACCCWLTYVTKRVLHQKVLVITLVVSRLLWLTVVYIGYTDLSANTCKNVPGTSDLVCRKK